MRVIAGIYKGRRLVAPDTTGTRPVTDRVKEAVFSSLGEVVNSADTIDLYAGSGNFGIEAMSRGARSAVFVESGRIALRALRSNLEALGIEAVVDSRSVESFVGTLGTDFDLAFVDPPWQMAPESLALVLDELAPHLRFGAMVIVSRRNCDVTPQPVAFIIDVERGYGDTRIIRYRKAP